jgi:hypothetical protein
MAICQNKTFSINVVLCIVLILLHFSLILAQDEEVSKEADQCLVCHQDVEVLPEDFHKEDIHLQKGLSCAGCHGGDITKEDMDEAKSRKAGFIGVPSKQEIPQFCGKCHADIAIMREYQPRITTDQVEQYYTSVHGKKLKTGDQKVADCTSCHSAHGILSARDSRSSVYPLNLPSTCTTCHGDAEYMREYNIATNQFEEYVESVHGKMLLEDHDIGSPACNDCHGNHGAIPPGISSISHVCGTCHVNNMQYFSASAMGEVFAEQELHACEECHGHHKVKKSFDAMIGVGEQSICLDCHSEGDFGYLVADEIYKQLNQMVTLYDSAQTNRQEVNQIGMNDIDIGFLLQDAHQSLIKARTLVHTFDPDKVGEELGLGISKTNEAILLASQEISDYQTRRRGFGIATIFITILVIALYFKIREMERK